MSNTKPKLIYHWTYVEWGGAQIYLLAIMKRAKEEWDESVILPRNSRPAILGFLDQLEITYEFIDAYTDTRDAPTIPDKLRRQWRRIHAEAVSYRRLSRYD